MPWESHLNSTYLGQAPEAPQDTSAATPDLPAVSPQGNEVALQPVPGFNWKSLVTPVVIVAVSVVTYQILKYMNAKKSSS